ncbi:MAG: DUF4406 domain-containing protein [Anaerolineales bacterium]|nr:DUF4406 domain-containing protein [Anaerolineales bacterium]
MMQVGSVVYEPLTRPRIYIAGPMTGLPEWNFPAFFAAAEALRAGGYEPVNPAEAFGGDTTRTHQEYMREACRQLATCQGILLLDGWRESKGAVFEAGIAHVTGMQFHTIGERPGGGVPVLFTIESPAVVPVVVNPTEGSSQIDPRCPRFESPWAESICSMMVHNAIRMPQAPRVLVLGYTQSGKTTVARMLCEEFGCEGPCNVGDVLKDWWEDRGGKANRRAALYHYGRAIELDDPTRLVREALSRSPIVTAHMPADVLQACVAEDLFDAYVWVDRGEQGETDPMSEDQWWRQMVHVPFGYSRSAKIVNDGDLAALREYVAATAKRIREQQVAQLTPTESQLTPSEMDDAERCRAQRWNQEKGE